ncbi:MAG: hypothetical protein PSX36_12665 [bacterium]|nr:hypothetical protein [bacterium]
MRITTKNYFKAISEVGVENLPEVLKKSHLLIEERTDKGNDWSIYENDAEVKRVFDLAFEKLEEFIDRKDNLSGLDGNPIIERAKQDAAGYKHLPLDKLKIIYRLECEAELEDGLTDEIKIRKPALEKAIAEKGGKETMKQESTIAQKFVKRFLLLNGKTHQKKEIEGFLNDVQGAIKEKEITKEDALSKQILLIQDKLLSLVNSMGKSIKVELSPTTKKQFQLALNKLKVKPKKKGLNGVEEEKETKPQQNLMSSIDFASLQFNSLGFKDKWFDLIGDPSPGFTAMVFGRPKMGKSYLCVDFAGYLARNHGTVLYVANEEKLDATLQMKLNDKDVKHENLFVSDYLPEDLSKYQFIILDSVNKLELSPKDLEKLKRNNPGKSFIFVFQTTKDGKFRGANSYQHDVDVVIEVPEKGKATQFGRFNAGGEMNIFDDAPMGESEDLNGIKKNKKPVVKKKTSKADWTEPEWLDEADWRNLKIIKKYVDQGKYKDAMNHAMDCDTVIREEIPGDIWKRMGGQLTKTGEEKLKATKGKPTPKVSEEKKKKPTIVFNMTVRALKGVIEREWDRELTDGDYIEILEIAEGRNSNFADVVNGIDSNLKDFSTTMWEAMKEWDKTAGKSEEKSRAKFDPRFYANRKDDDNPSFIFTGTSSKLLAEAIEGDFDLIYLVRRELANRGQDSKGKWVGFDEAKKIHRIGD